MNTGSPSNGYKGVLLSAVVFSLLLGGANLFMGDLNQDEGWYLYAAQRVADGWVPYRDFAFTQGPMLPLVYALFSPVIDSFGLGGGRVITWLLGFTSSVLAYAVARRLGGAVAGVLALTLLLANVYQSYFTTVVKTYSLCAWLIMVAVYALCRWIEVEPVQRRAGWLVMTGVFLSMAAATRLSSGILLPLVGVWLLVDRDRWGKLSWLWFGVGGGVTLLAVVGPFFLLAPEGARFGLIEFHTLREAGGAGALLVYKGGFVSRIVQAYFVAVVLLALMAAAKWWRPFRGIDTGYHQSDAFALVRLLWIAVGSMTLVHSAAPFPYDDYQVPVFPVLAVALAVSWSYALRAWSGLEYRWERGVAPADPPVARWFAWSVLLASMASAVSSPVNQDWVIAGRDRIWWKTRDKPALLHLRDVARDLRREAVDGLLLTQDLYLAVEAGLKVPRGWEMGPFSYYPDFTDERAEALRLVNRDGLLRELSSSPARRAAFSGYGLSIASPEVVPLDEAHREQLLASLEARYEKTGEVAGFGQASTTLAIYRLKDAP